MSVEGSSGSLRLCKACAAASGYEVLPDASAESGKVCPACGQGVSALASGGRLGCVACVAAFRRELALLWRRSGRPARYIGKVPRGLATGSLATLREELLAALADEDFERAAVLRDAIRERGGEAQA